MPAGGKDGNKTTVRNTIVVISYDNVKNTVIDVNKYLLCAATQACYKGPRLKVQVC